MVTLTKDVTLSPGESKVVPFEVIPTEAKVYSVNVDGLTGSFRAVSPEVVLTSLYGYISDAETGSAITEVKVSLNSHIFNSDPYGNYWFENVEVRTYTLTFEKAGYETVTMEKVLLDMSETFPYYNWQNVEMVKAPLPPPLPGGREFISHSVTYHYVPGFKATQVKGKFATMSVTQTKKGLAGLEQDIVTRINGVSHYLEAIDWYYDKGVYKVGLVGYKGNILVLHKTTPSVPGQEYSYLISIEANGVRGQVWDKNGNLLVDGLIPGKADYLREITTFLEYWRYYSGGFPSPPTPPADQFVWELGEFHYKGYHIIEGLYDPTVGWKTPYLCLRESYDWEWWNTHDYALNVLYIHHHGIWEHGYYYDECEINDVV